METLPAPSMPLWAPVPPWTTGQLLASWGKRGCCVLHISDAVGKQTCEMMKVDLDMLLFPSAAVCGHTLRPRVMQTAVFIVSTCIFKTTQKEKPWFLFNCSLFSVFFYSLCPVTWTTGADWPVWTPDCQWWSRWWSRRQSGVMLKMLQMLLIAVLI